MITKNDAGFRNRQWESDVTGQQYRTKREALAAEAEELAYRQRVADFASAVHTYRGETIVEGLPYGVPHDYDCPACIASGASFTASPRSETYWSS